tara:strand:- start:373 stop:660 length:288 start_codon:yes stop_codon:yes gene_type:complete
LGNPNYNTKLFLLDNEVSSIVDSNTIYLFRVESKIQTLLSYYLPSSNSIEKFEELINYKYIITSDINLIEKSDINNVFRTIKKFDNHILLINIVK